MASTTRQSTCGQLWDPQDLARPGKSEGTAALTGEESTAREKVPTLTSSSRVTSQGTKTAPGSCCSRAWPPDSAGREKLGLDPWV